jgi:S1-C subfamily serine protease
VASDGQGNSETLTGLIETNAAVQPGDSGGPLLNAAGRVVGMITAGSAGFRFQGSGGDGYAVPINRALVIARQIEAGKASAEIHVGETAFLGVQISDPRPDAGVAGAVVVSVVAGTPAEAAGLGAGDVITSLDGRAIASAADLQAAVLALTPGTPVAIEWTDQNGGATSGQVTPASGPPQ